VGPQRSTSGYFVPFVAEKFAPVRGFDLDVLLVVHMAETAVVECYQELGRTANTIGSWIGKRYRWCPATSVPLMIILLVDSMIARSR
jgi:hypothetical protein